MKALVILLASVILFLFSPAPNSKTICNVYLHSFHLLKTSSNFQKTQLLILKLKLAFLT